MFEQPVEFFHEDQPPYLLRGQALPYPDLQRVWVRAQLAPFAGHPELEMVILDPAAQPVAGMIMVDVQFTYVSLTLHLRQPQPDAPYVLLLRLTRDHTLLDQRAIPFTLTFVARDEAKAEAESLIWPERGVQITPLDPEDDLSELLPEDEPAPPSTNGAS